MVSASAASISARAAPVPVASGTTPNMTISTSPGLAKLSSARPVGLAVAFERQHDRRRVGEDGGELVVGHHGQGEPQPVLADPAIEIAIPGDVRPLDTADGEAGVRRRRFAWRTSRSR